MRLDVVNLFKLLIMKNIQFKIEDYITANLLIVFVLCILTSCEKYPLNESFNYGDLVGEFLGEPYPDTIAVRFCPDFFIEELHTPPIFSPDLSEMYFKPMSSVGYAKILEMKMEGDSWTEPFYASFNFNSINDAPYITRDGERLYFLSDKEATYKNYDENIYYVSREGDDWSDPKMISGNINDYELHWQFSVADNYNIYFQDVATKDLYFSKYVDGEYEIAEKLGEKVNSPLLEEGTPFIAGDESYICFDRRSGGYSDLMISFKNADDQWMEAITLGPNVNTLANELCPYITADDRFMFFLRMTDEGSFPFWVDASFIEDLRPDR